MRSICCLLLLGLVGCEETQDPDNRIRIVAKETTPPGYPNVSIISVDGVEYVDIGGKIMRHEPQAERTK